jgi:conjugative transposon TraM protein
MKQVNVRKKKAILFLPVIVIPFLTLGFYALGGGQGKADDAVKLGGLNLRLPDANLKDDQRSDKLSFYDRAERDSAKLEEWMRSDPYYKDRLSAYEPSSLEELTETNLSKYGQRLKLSPYEQGTNPEDALLKKLALLEKELNPTTNGSVERETEHPGTSEASKGNDVERMAKLMQMLQTKEEGDPEIQQLSTVMDKILDVQHPQRVKERMQNKPDLPVQHYLTISDRAAADTTDPGFYGMDAVDATVAANAIRAVVHEEQVLVNGSIVKLRLLQAMFIGNVEIPAGNFVYGVVNLQGERLGIDISSIRSGTSIYQVKLEVYDMDGLQGVHIPGAITREVAKESADNNLQLMDLGTTGSSFKMQAATAGINSIKNLLSRKVKLVKVSVKAGYQLLIKNKTNVQ